MTCRDRVRFGDTVIQYEVRRSARRKKTVQITLEGSEVQVTAPDTLPASDIRRIVLQRAPWIVARMSDTGPPVPPRQFVSGETLPYLGRDVRLLVEPADVASPTVRFHHWRFLVSVPQTPDEDGHPSGEIRDAISNWYRARAAERLTQEVDCWWGRLGNGDRPRILIRSQRKRWGSCAADGTLRFNWRVMMLEAPLIEYIVVHELAHLTVRNHSASFWKLVAEVLPDVQERRQRLREIERTLPL